MKEEFTDSTSIEEKKRKLARSFPAWRRVMPEFAEVARKSLLQTVREKHPEHLYSKAWYLPSDPGSDLPEGVELLEKERADGKGAQDVVRLENGIVPLKPVATPFIDSRKEPFKGNSEMTAFFLGQYLGQAVLNEMDKRQTRTGHKEKLSVGEVLVEGCILAGREKVNGMNLCETCPLMRASAVVIFRRS